MTAPGTDPILEVLDPGLLSTVQDAGRPDAVRWGVPPGGACDRWALTLANLRCGNDRHAAALELTLVPPRLRVLRATTISLAGADLGIELHGGSGSRPITPGAVIDVEPGDEVAPSGRPPAGCRAMLAVRGGLDVGPVLGSRSTALAAGFGGVEGRALRTGDLLRAGATGDAGAAGPAGDGPGGRTVPPIGSDGLDVPSSIGDGSIGLLPGPTGDDDAVDALVAATWTVGPVSDRMGLRLDGRPLEPAAAPVTSHGVTFGTVQLPPDGRPIVLLADHQPTGGYPVPAIVPEADHPRLAQLRPGDQVRFQRVSLEAAVAALRRQRAVLEAVERACRDDRAWDEAWRSAGA